MQVFAKPFIGALSGHMDGVSCLAKNPRHLNSLVSASLDGGIQEPLSLHSCFSMQCIFHSFDFSDLWIEGEKVRNMNTNEGTFIHYAADIRLWDVAYK